MRLRVQTVPPLPELKAWFSVHSTDSWATVGDLKSALCSRVQVLRDASVQALQVVLFLDDFELLKESDINVVRDGDLICIKLSSTPTLCGRKIHEDSPSPRKSSSKRTRDDHRKSALRHPDQSVKRKRLESSSSSSSECDSDTGESVSSSRSSSSLSSSSPPSTNGSLSATGRSPIHVRAAAPGNYERRDTLLASHIPPGFGKPSTQRRNLRRRLKKRYDKHCEKQQTTQLPDSTVGTKPFVLKHTAAPVAYSATASVSNLELDVGMSSLRNKNKKKGFRKSMTKPYPQKIVFSAGTETSVTDCVPSPSPMTSVAGSAVLVGQTFNAGLRLIAPSEKQSRGELPDNVFVTTVDLEEGLHLKKSRRWSETPRLIDGEQVDAVGANIGQVGPSNDERSGRRIGWGVSSGTAWEDVPQLDLDQAERDWDSSAEITTIVQLQAGQIVGWKALTIHPTTLTPEILLTVARVLECDGQTAVVRPLHRPRAGLLSFDGLSEHWEIEDEQYTWTDILQGKWRLVHTI